MSKNIDFSKKIQYNIKCTFNLNSKKLRGEEAFLNDEEIKNYMLDRGHEIAVHGAMHRAEGLIHPLEGIKDVLDCRLELEKRFGLIIRGMAYPDVGIKNFSNSASYDDIKHYLKDLNIVYARTTNGDNNLFELPTDWYCWIPTAHHGNLQIMEYINEFVTLDLSQFSNYAAHRPKLFYLWGHSHEFERNDNWELLEDICRNLGNKEDIWYATNMELYEYINAYNSLIFSADYETVYNPTLFDICFFVDGKNYKISSGETLKII